MTTPTIAERTAAFAAERGAPATVTRTVPPTETEAKYDRATNTWSDPPASPPPTSFTTDVFEDDPEDDDYRDGTSIVRDPVVLLIPNSPAVTFAPDKGMRVEYLGKGFSLAKARPYVLDGTPQFWRVVGGV